jgi:hypothetical protein
MRLKTLLISIAVLAALAVIVAFVRRPSAPASSDPRVNQPLVDAAVIEKTTKIRITDAGKKVELARQSDGTWRVPSYYDMPVDFTKLSTFVNNLTDAKLQRLVTSNADRIARLDFKDTKIELLDEGGKEIWSVTLGKTAETGGRFARFGSEQKAYLASFQAWLDPEPKNWANSTLVSLKPEDIAKIELAFPGNETVTLTRAKKEDPWSSAQTADQQTINTDKVSSILNSLGTIRFTGTTDPADAKVTEARAHTRDVKLTTFDGKTVSLTFARKPEEKKLKPPATAGDEKSGPAALGPPSEAGTGETKAPVSDPKLATPEYETIPAGPVFVNVFHSDPSAPVNALMQKRAFQISDYTFTSLPSSKNDLFQSTPTPAPAAPEPAVTPTEAPNP